MGVESTEEDPINSQRQVQLKHETKKCSMCMVLRDLGDKGNIIARGINYYLGVIKFIIIEPGVDGMK